MGKFTLYFFLFVLIFINNFILLINDNFILYCFHRDLSENLEWIRRYHASEHQPQTFTGRLWRSIRTGISPTSVANPNMASSSSSSKRDNHPQSGVAPPPGSSSSSSSYAGRKQQQHQDILMALSERELQRQYDEYQERQSQQRQIQHQMHQTTPTEIPVNNNSQRKSSKGKLSELPAITDTSADATALERANSLAALRRPSDVGLEAAVASHTNGSGNNNSHNGSKSHQLVTPRLLPPILSSIITGTSNSNLLGTATTGYQSGEYSSVNDNNNNNIHNAQRLPRSAQKYGSGKNSAATGSSNKGHDSLYHPPTTLLAYSR